jgi:CTP synthase
MSSPVCLSAAWFSILLAALFVAAGQAQTRSDGGESVAKRNSGNPFFMASQFHPEFRSKPHQPHPMFKGFIAAVHTRIQQKPIKV